MHTSTENYVLRVLRKDNLGTRFEEGSTLGTNRYRSLYDTRFQEGSKYVRSSLGGILVHVSE